MAKKRDPEDPINPEEITAANVDEILGTIAEERQPEPDPVAAAAAEAPVDSQQQIAQALAAIANTQAMLVQMMAVVSQKAADGDGQATALAKILGPALERLAESNLAGAKLVTEEQRRSHRPSNEFPHLRSVFNRRGLRLEDQYPEGHAFKDEATGDTIDPVKVPLKCIMMLPWLAEWESLTREEVELLNLLQAGDYVVKRTDNSKVKISISMEYKVDGHTPTRMLINHETAYNNDNQRLWPPIVEWTRQVLRQHDQETARLAAAVMSDEEEEALIEAGVLMVSQ